MTTSHHALKKLNVRKGCTAPTPLTCPNTKKYDGTEKFATTGSVDGCSILPEIQCVGTRLHLDSTQASYVCMLFNTCFISRGFPSPFGSCRRKARICPQTVFRGSIPDFSSKLSPEVFSTRGYLCKTVGF